MTVVMTMDVPVSRADLEAVSAELGTHDNPPDGLIVHVATATADGVHVTDVWASEAAFEKFRDDQLVPTMMKFMAEHNMPRRPHRIPSLRKRSTLFGDDRHPLPDRNTAHYQMTVAGGRSA
jgi:hypothetical protein